MASGTSRMQKQSEVNPATRKTVRCFMAMSDSCKPQCPIDETERIERNVSSGRGDRVRSAHDSRFDPRRDEASIAIIRRHLERRQGAGGVGLLMKEAVEVGDLEDGSDGWVDRTQAQAPVP